MKKRYVLIGIYLLTKLEPSGHLTNLVVLLAIIYLLVLLMKKLIKILKAFVVGVLDLFKGKSEKA